MKRTSLSIAFSLPFFLATGTAAFADHNSPFGAGWAEDHMGMHTAAIEDLDTTMGGSQMADAGSSVDVDAPGGADSDADAGGSGDGAGGPGDGAGGNGAGGPGGR